MDSLKQWQQALNSLEEESKAAFSLQFKFNATNKIKFSKLNDFKNPKKRK